MITHARLASGAPRVLAASALGLLVASVAVPGAVAGEATPAVADRAATHSASATTESVSTTGGVARANVTKVPSGPIVVPAGMPLAVELTANVNTRTSRVGDRVEARLAHDLVVVDDRVAASAGAVVTGTVTEVAPGNDATGGEPTLALMFDSLVARNGATVPIKARYRQHGHGAAGAAAASAAGGGEIRLRAGTVVDATMETTISIY
ncbi:MAG TPA: hypothetical protein VNS57_05680 [Steroidobacteraceae bacterium]|nr:hypothetical protein [Steroidobacteraceae bacterium]